MPDLTRLSVNLNTTTAGELTELMDRHGRSATETLRRAVGVLRYFDEEIAGGKTVEVVDRKGCRREIVFL